MSIFRAPEVPTRYGALDNEAFEDMADDGAEVVREQVRGSNLLTGREHLVYRWVTRANPPASEVGWGLACAPPFWQLALPMLPEGTPVEKKYGLRRVRMRIRAEIDDQRMVEIHLATSNDSDPNAASAPTMVLRGVGAPEVYEVEDVPVRRAAGEVIALYMRARVDLGNDPLLDTATFGGANSGVIDSANNLFSMRDVGAGWNATGNMAHLGGHYLVTRDQAGAQRMGAAEIRAVGPDAGAGLTDELIFSPPATDYRHLIGANYEIRKLPHVRFFSVAIYAQDRGST